MFIIYGYYILKSNKYIYIIHFILYALYYYIINSCYIYNIFKFKLMLLIYFLLIFQ